MRGTGAGWFWGGWLGGGGDCGGVSLEWGRSWKIMWLLQIGFGRGEGCTWERKSLSVGIGGGVVVGRGKEENG